MLNANQYFSIGAVARAIGVTTHALRAWESRYQLHASNRTKSGHRQYTPTDLQKLKLIKSAMGNGYKISDVARLSVAQLTQLNLSLKLDDKSNNSNKSVQQIRYLVYGENLAHLLFKSKLALKYQSVNTLEQLNRSICRGNGIWRGLLLEFDEINHEIEELIYTIKLNFSQSNRIIIFTRIATGKNAMARLVKANVMIVQTKPNQMLVNELVGKLLDDTKIKPSYRRSILDDTQLQNLLTAKSKIVCECPQHLADIYIKLNEFIRYSEQCEQQSPKDSAVHQHISRELTTIRGAFTQLIFDVADVDGIDL